MKEIIVNQSFPEDWQTVRIKDIFHVETGTTPSTKVSEYWEDGEINWITPADMSKLDNKGVITDSGRKISEKALKETNLTLMPRDSLIISTRAPVGYVAIVEKETTFNQGCKGLIPKDDKEAYGLFYLYYLLSKRRELENRSSGSTFKELSKKLLENLFIPLPSLPEQRKIAEILGSVDSAIQVVDSAIAKAERLKKGLMQDLLTKGIGHTKFRDTEIGRIPEEWEVVRLGDVGEGFQYGLSIKMSEEGQYPIIKMDSLINGEVQPVNLRYVNLDENTFQKYRLEKGDILINRTNSYELVGRSGIFMLDGDYVFASYLIRIKPDKKRLFSKFMAFYLLFSLERLRKMATRAVSQANINASNLRKFKLPLPPLSEQKKIAEILSTVDEKIALEKERMAKLERVKKGLMNDLLTGRKRVKVDGKEV